MAKYKPTQESIDRHKRINTFKHPVTNFSPPDPRGWPGIRRKKYWLKNMWEWATNGLWGECVFFYQRGRYGYSIRDWWSIDYHLTEWLPECIRKYKDGMGYPGMSAMGVCTPEEESNYGLVDGKWVNLNISDEQMKEWETEALKRWHQILEDMALGFEGWSAHYGLDNHSDFYDEQGKELDEKMHRRWEGKPSETHPHYTTMLNDEEVGLHFDQEGWDKLQAERLAAWEKGSKLFIEFFGALWD